MMTSEQLHSTPFSELPKSIQDRLLLLEQIRKANFITSASWAERWHTGKFDDFVLNGSTNI